jgi:hypothetical protein
MTSVYSSNHPKNPQSFIVKMLDIVIAKEFQVSRHIDTKVGCVSGGTAIHQI